MAVCFYHANLSGFGGGYVGVDIFFVVSGFLIASLISSQIEQGTFSFALFYERRIRRIFPALLNLALWSILAALVVLNPEDILDFGRSLMAMTAFVSNLYFSQQASLGGYFGDLSAQYPLLHTWSLSIEEQFYIFFPVMFVMTRRWIGKWQTYVFVFITAVSLVLNVQGMANRDASFFFLTPRIWEFMCGALLATTSLSLLKHRLSREIIGWIGVTLVCYAIVAFDKSTTFPGLNALYPCIGAILVIHAGSSGTSYVRTLLSLPPLVFVGVISYSLYLWHWPIFVFAKVFLVHKLDTLETIGAIALAVLAAFASFELIEVPFRKKSSSIGRRKVFGFSAVAGLVCLLVGGVLEETGGLPQRYDLKTREVVAKNIERKKDGFSGCDNYQTEMHQMSDMNFCKFGNSQSDNVMFWGDSSVSMLGGMIKETQAAGDLSDRGAILAIASGCPVIPNVNHWLLTGYHCDDFNKFALQRANADDVGTVFLAFGPWHATVDGMCVTANGQCLRKLLKSEITGYFIESLRSMIQELHARGKRVIVSLPFPVFDTLIPDAEIHNARFGAFFDPIVPAADTDWVGVRGLLITMAKDVGADIFDPCASLCDGKRCKYETAGVSIYRDGYHIASSQAWILKADLIKTLKGP